MPFLISVFAIILAMSDTPYQILSLFLGCFSLFCSGPISTNPVNPFLHLCDISATFRQNIISWPAELRFCQFKVRRTSVHVFQTRVSDFKTPCNIWVPVWQSRLYNMILNNHPNLGFFWPKRLYFDSRRSIFSNSKVVMFLFTSCLVSMQVLAFKVNNQCLCDTGCKGVRRSNFLLFFV